MTIKRFKIHNLLGELFNSVPYFKKKKIINIFLKNVKEKSPLFKNILWITRNNIWGVTQ